LGSLILPTTCVLLGQLKAQRLKIMLDTNMIDRLKRLAVSKCEERLKRAKPPEEYGITNLLKQKYL
jgi:hypothetical protein